MSTIERTAHSRRPDVGPVVGSTGTSAADQFCCLAFAVGRDQARRAGARYDGLDDCGLDFVVHVVDGLRRRRQPESQVSRSWLEVCAANWALNECRSTRRRLWHERVMTDVDVLAGADDSLSSADRIEGIAVRGVGPAESEAEQLVLRGELCAYVDAALSLLTRSQYELWLMFYVDERSVEEIASATGRTPHAVNQALYTLRRRVRALLNDAGLTRRDLMEYLAFTRTRRDFPNGIVR